MIITVLAFLVTLGLLIVIHEYGHYRVAVACGVKVLRFSVGFGKVVWRYQRTPDSTEFVVAALPLGGYVRMLDGREAVVPPEQRAQAFNHKPLWQRAAIVAAGPAANLLLAIGLYAAAHWVGIDEPRARLASPPAASVAAEAGLRGGDLVQAWSANGQDWQDLRSMTDLRWEMTQAVIQGAPLHLMVSDGRGQGHRVVTLPLDTLGTRDIDAQALRRIGLGTPYRPPVLGVVVEGGPADRAGLRAGDEVLSVNGEQVGDAASLLALIRQHAASSQGEALAAMQWRVQRGEDVVTTAVTPKVVDDGGQRIGRVEVQLGGAPEMVTVRYGAWDGVSRAVGKTWEMSTLTLKMLGRMISGEASLKNLSGPLTIADYAGQSVRMGLAYYLGFLAVVSISLGVLNLLPLPMLDGGHLMFYLFEAVTGRPPSDVWMERLQRGGVAIMLMMMSLALFNDVSRLMGSH